MQKLKTMLNFLRNSRKFLNTKDTCIVIGNESCDLDSACSALCLAFYYQQHATELQRPTKAKNFLPVLNVPRRDYPLKTEVCHLLNKYEIPEAILTFRDELEDDFTNSNDFILVDHHVSPFSSRCVAVFDHRPKEENANLPRSQHVHIELVGSCATLIAETITNGIDGNKNCLPADLIHCLHLLRATIILDTVNFEPNAARFTAKDLQICECLEQLLTACDEKLESRQKVFETLRQARADVSKLTAAQLLRKDLKFVKSKKDGKILAFPGFPLKVKMFIEKADAVEAVKAFAAENNCEILILLGMFVNDEGLLERDVGFINLSDNPMLCTEIEESLLKSTAPSLQLEKLAEITFLDGKFYKQLNVKATRKHILPIVKNVLDSAEPPN